MNTLPQELSALIRDMYYELELGALIRQQLEQLRTAALYSISVDRHTAWVSIITLEEEKEGKTRIDQFPWTVHLEIIPAWTARDHEILFMWLNNDLLEDNFWRLYDSHASIDAQDTIPIHITALVTCHDNDRALASLREQGWTIRGDTAVTVEHLFSNDEPRRIILDFIE